MASKKKSNTVKFLLGVSIALNLLLTVVLFQMYISFKQEVAEIRVESQMKPTVTTTSKNTRQNALSACASNFAEKFSSYDGSLEGITTDEINDLRQFAMESCMEQKGFEY